MPSEYSLNSLVSHLMEIQDAGEQIPSLPSFDRSLVGDTHNGKGKNQTNIRSELLEEVTSR